MQLLAAILTATSVVSTKQKMTNLTGRGKKAARPPIRQDQVVITQAVVCIYNALYHQNTINLQFMNKDAPSLRVLDYI